MVTIVPQHVFSAFFYLCRCFVPLLSMVMVVPQHNMYPSVFLSLLALPCAILSMVVIVPCHAIPVYIFQLIPFMWLPFAKSRNGPDSTAAFLFTSCPPLVVGFR